MFGTFVPFRRASLDIVRGSEVVLVGRYVFVPRHLDGYPEVRFRIARR